MSLMMLTLWMDNTGIPSFMTENSYSILTCILRQYEKAVETLPSLIL